ncbi:MAG: [LysW]-lysine hydrolase [Planctomycetota bacterium]
MTTSATSTAEPNAAHTHPPTDDAALATLRALVGTPSVSGEEAAAVRIFADHAAALGFDVEIDEAGSAIATRGDSSSDAQEIILLGHIDTVPGDITVREEAGELWGRGSVDAKGPLAAMLLAAAGADLPTNARVRVIAAVGEETPTSPGARTVAPRFRPNACIIGEPSGVNGVTLGYKGRLLAKLSTTQPGGHTAGQHGSAADATIDWLNEARSIIDRLNRINVDAARLDSAFDTITHTVQHLGTTTDGLHDTATIDLGLRLPTWISPQELQAELSAHTPANTSLDFVGHERAHCTTRNDPVVRALTTSIRAAGLTPRPKRKTGTADLNVVAPVWNCPIAAYGPGDSSLDHTPDERLSLDEYLASITVLRRALETLAEELTGTPNA